MRADSEQHCPRETASLTRLTVNHQVPRSVAEAPLPERWKHDVYNHRESVVSASGCVLCPRLHPRSSPTGL